MSSDNYTYEPRGFGSFRYCLRCEGHNTIATKTILLAGHNDSGEYSCAFHEDAVIHDMRQYEERNLIVDLSPKITRDLKVQRSNGAVENTWCVRKYILQDGIGTTYLGDDGEVMIRIGKYDKYDNRIIQCQKDIKLCDLLNDNEIDPLTLDLPQTILDKLNINVANTFLKFVD